MKQSFKIFLLATIIIVLGLSCSKNKVSIGYEFHKWYDISYQNPFYYSFEKKEGIFFKYEIVAAPEHAQDYGIGFNTRNNRFYVHYTPLKDFNGVVEFRVREFQDINGKFYHTKNHDFVVEVAQ